MLKTIATFAALATLAATTIAPAHAHIAVNGVGENGVTRNGGGDNGIARNGGGTNGITRNGGGSNGAASGSSTLTIEAIELPPETR